MHYKTWDAAIIEADTYVKKNAPMAGLHWFGPIDGARALARTTKADSYCFLGWDYMDMPADPCSKRKVVFEFIDSQGKSVSRVEFNFEAGRVVSADGWERSFEIGRL